MTLLYLVRHGETEMNQSGVYYGWTDCLLSEKGRRQAAEVAEKLSGASFDAIISSPLSRAQETARLIRSSQSPVLMPPLREINFGSWEGKHYLEISRDNPQDWLRWTGDWQNAAPPGGESYSQFYQRVTDCLSALLENYQGQTLLLVAHHGSLRIILSQLLGLGREGYWHFTFTQGRFSLLEIQDGHCVVKGINN